MLLAIFLVVGPLLDRMMLALERMATRRGACRGGDGTAVALDYAGVERMLRELTVLRYCLRRRSPSSQSLAVLWFFFVRSDEETAIARL